MNNYVYFSNLTVEELSVKTVIPCRTDDGRQCVLIKSSELKSISSEVCTDSLRVTLNRVMESEGRTFYFHSIESKKIDGFSEKQFDVLYDYIFKKIQSPIKDGDLYSLIKSIEDYFQTTVSSGALKLQVGFFGELLFVRYLHDTIYPSIMQNYHEDFFSKHDIEISARKRIEVKTSLSQKRIHHFKHDQLARTDITVYVGSLLLEEAETGLSLYQLAKEIIELTPDPDRMLAIEKMLVKCGVDEDEQGFTASEEKAINDIRIFSSGNLPAINSQIPNGVSNVEYDVDCSFAISISLDEFMEWLKN